MFERYTEKARRSIFFARYEAGQFGSRYIDTEHLLLGLLREDPMLRRLLPDAAEEGIRQQMRKNLEQSLEKISTPVDLPLSGDAKRSLMYAAEEAAALEHRSIECGHLVLGLLRVEGSRAAVLLRERGIDFATLRPMVASGPLPRQEAPGEGLRSAAVSLTEPVAKLSQLVERTVAELGRRPETFGDQRLQRKPWTRREALGHLIDWATVHHTWFARALTEPDLAASGYPGEEWVAAQRYREFSWTTLVELWSSLNRLLIHVLAQIPEEKLQTPCRIGVEAPAPLRDLIARYRDHCEDVVGQLLAQGPG